MDRSLAPTAFLDSPIKSTILTLQFLSFSILLSRRYQPMTDAISPELFAHLVNLAALELAPDEAEYLRNQLNNQLKAIQELVAIPLDEDIPLASHGVPFTPQISPVLRKDTWEPSMDAPAIMAQVPQEADGYIVVPDIPHTELK